MTRLLEELVMSVLAWLFGFVVFFLLAAVAHAQVYPVFNFRYHDAYAWLDPAYYPAQHVGGLGFFPELEWVIAPFGSLWLLQSNAPPTCSGTCSDPRFTGCGPGQLTTISWPPVRLGTPLQACGGACAGAYLTLASSRAITFAGTQTLCGHADGFTGRQDELCDRAAGTLDGGGPYMLTTSLGQLQSTVILSNNTLYPAVFTASQSGAGAAAPPGVNAAGAGTVSSSLELHAFSDGTARWAGTWTVLYWNLGCRLDFPLIAVAAGQP